MIQKKFLTVISIIFLFSFLAVSMPSVVDAAEPSVSDSLKEKKPDTKQPETDNTTEVAAAEDVSLIAIVGKLIVYTLLILVMIYGLIKFLALKQRKLQPNQAVRLMGGTPLGNNKSLQLVKVGGQVYLIGVGDQVTLIKEFTSPEEIDSIESSLDLDKEQTLLPNSITNLIKDKMAKRTDDSESAKFNLSFEKLFNQSLSKQKAKQDQIEQELAKEDEDKEGRQP